MLPKRNERHEIKKGRQLGTANAISMVNTEGKWETIKVKTSRYIPGKIPEFANTNLDVFENQEEYGDLSIKDNDISITNHQNDPNIEHNNNNIIIRVSERLATKISGNDKEEPSLRSNQIISNPLMDTRALRLLKKTSNSDMDHNFFNNDANLSLEAMNDQPINRVMTQNDTTIKRSELNAKLLAQHDQDMMMSLDKNNDNLSAEDSTETSDDDDDEDYGEFEDERIHLKPIFVRRKDRLTLNSANKDLQECFNDKKMDKKAKIEHKNHLLNAIDKEMQMKVENPGIDIEKLAIEYDSDLGDEDIEFQQWKIRELKRIKRDKEELEQMRKEKEEVNKIHEMSEEKRLEYLIKNPKIITNQSERGKYNFLQKFYHRGVFYLDQEEDVLKRNVDLPSMDDNFDRSKLPKIMQVRNFGKANRTKYTHLVAEDTNEYLNPLNNNKTIQSKNLQKAGGMKQTYERPSNKK